MQTETSSKLERWQAAGLLDAETAERIRVFELNTAKPTRSALPITIALSFGALMLAAGILLFVAAHWDQLSPVARFTLVLAMLVVLHALGAITRTGHKSLSVAFHAVGTVALGAGIFLTGQIFNLQEHWPAGIMLWAIGALFGWLLLRDWPQLALLAVLAPAWLISEWADATKWYSNAHNAPSVFVLALAVMYFTSVGRERATSASRSLVWIGGILFLPAYLVTTFSSAHYVSNQSRLPRLDASLGWTLAILLPLAVAWFIRKRIDLFCLSAVAWSFSVFLFPFGSDYPPQPHPMIQGLAAFCAGMLGAIGLIAWGMHDRVRNRVNMGMALLVIVVTIFYFSDFMDKLGRSTSLMLFGILFLVGGYFAERTRKRLISKLDVEATR